MEEFVVYILYSAESDKSYVGFTSHLIERVALMIFMEVIGQKLQTMGCGPS
jgi:hypothetical protein